MSNPMLPHLSRAARELRESHDRLAVHVAAELRIAESTVSRFERGRWPRDPDKMLAGYARDLGIDELEIWERALDLMRQSG